MRTMRACVSIEKSEISSKRIVPPLARAKIFAGPSNSIMSLAITVTNGKFRRSEKSCNMRAIKLLPLPLSPEINTGKSAFITRATTRYNPCITGVFPIKGMASVSSPASKLPVSRARGAALRCSNALATRFIKSGKSNGFGK